MWYLSLSLGASEGLHLIVVKVVGSSRQGLVRAQSPEANALGNHDIHHHHNEHDEHDVHQEDQIQMAMALSKYDLFTSIEFYDCLLDRNFLETFLHKQIKFTQ